MHHDPAGADRDGAVYVHHAGAVLTDGPFVELAQSVAVIPDGLTEPEPVRVVLPDGTERNVAEAGALADALALAVETAGGAR